MIKNLVAAKDITALKTRDSLTGDELQLLQQESFKEQQLQMNCKRIFDGISCQDNKYQYYFQQNDNGGYSNIAAKKLKAAQGTISGWPDVTLWKFVQGVEKSIFIEFKRPKETNISKNQQLIHKQLSDAGKEVYLCNNTVYFEKVICKEFLITINNKNMNLSNKIFPLKLLQCNVVGNRTILKIKVRTAKTTDDDRLIAIEPKGKSLIFYVDNIHDFLALNFDYSLAKSSDLELKLRSLVQRKLEYRPLIYKVLPFNK